MGLKVMRIRGRFRDASMGSSEVSRVVAIGFQGSLRRILGDTGRLQRVFMGVLEEFQGVLYDFRGFRRNQGVSGCSGRYPREFRV